MINPHVLSLAGTIERVQGAHINLQWPWDEALSLVIAKFKLGDMYSLYDELAYLAGLRPKEHQLALIRVLVSLLPQKPL